MITKDIYGKTLSTQFYSAIDAYSQKVKPKIVLTLLDSRHVDNLTITTNDSGYASNSKGTHADQMSGNTASCGYFFTPSQSMNGIQRQAYTWAVSDEKDAYGKTITANGQWHCMPSSLDDEYEYGWRSNTKSTSSALDPMEEVSGSHYGYELTTPMYIEYNFTTRKVNKIKIITSEFNGKISVYKIEVSNNTLSTFYTTYGLIEKDEYFKEHKLPASLSNDVNKIKITVYSTQNPSDNVRIQEVCPLYEVDITDYVISHSLDRQGELWENSIPIAGTGSSSASVVLDNTTKAFNPYNSNSLYGKYMKKDLKLNIYNGWRIVKTDSLLISEKLSSNITSSSTTIYVENASNFIVTGSTENPFLLVLDKDTVNEEIVLCSSRTDKAITVLERGYFGTTAKAHLKGVTATFEPYEYVNGGEFYIDEWSGGTSMQVTAKCLDKTKFLTEKQITKGFYVQNSTVGNAIEKLLMSINLSKKELKQIQPYSLYAKTNAIAAYSFSTPVQRDESALILNQGLRARIWKIENGKENEVKDIKADALDITLSDYDKAMRVKPYIPATYVGYSSMVGGGFNYNTNYALDIEDFSVTVNGTTHSEYVNGVFDGYYISNTSSDQDIKITVRNAGVKVYIDDTIVIDKWAIPSKTTTYTYSSYDYLGRSLNLDNGVPYKIRIEFYHPDGAVGTSSSMIMKLNKYVPSLESPLDDVLTPISLCTTVVVEDFVGSRKAPFAKSSQNRNHHKNNGLYIKSAANTVPITDSISGLVSEPTNKSVKIIQNTKVKIPYHTSLNVLLTSGVNYTGEFTYELYAKFPDGAFTDGGAYIGNEATGPLGYGFTFFYNNSGNGFTLHASNENAIVVDEHSLDANKWHHICVTFKDQTLKYYLNGVLKDTATGVVPMSLGYGDIDFNNSNDSKTFYIDEFAIYNKVLDDETIKNRYISTQIRELTIFPHLYGNEQSAKSIIDAISLGDFGRFFVDEEDYFTYYHFYRFFEPSIAQHSEIQKTISSNTHIISGDYNVQLQTNKVTVNVTEQNPLLTQRQGIWTATPDPSTLAVVSLTDGINSTANSIPVTSTDRPPFPSSGYLKIQDEIVKYSSIDSTHFLGVERGQFETTAQEHYSGDYAREARYYEIKYDSAPAFNVQSPLITAITYEYPPQIELVKFSSTAYNAELLLAASTSVNLGEYAYIQGTNPLTGVENFTSIAGTPIKKQDSSNLVKKQSATLSDDIKKYGLKEVVIDNEYIYSAQKAQEIADFLIEKFKDPVPVLNITSMAIPTLQIGDRIRISSFNSLDIENTDYWVVSHSLNVGDSLDHSIVLRKVVA